MIRCQCLSNQNCVKMERLLVLSLNIILVSYLIRNANACSGYKLHVDYFRNCGKNDVVQLSDDFQPTLNDDCSVTLWGCTTVKHAFKSAQMTYEINKNGVVYSGTKNACDALEGAHGEVLDILDSVGAPRTCPVKEAVICGHGKHVNIRKHRIKLPVMSGTTTGRMELKTNSGDACIEFSATLSRRLFSG